MSGFRDKMNKFMQGRYGVDDLSRSLMIVILVVMVLSIFLQSGFLNFLVLAGLIYIYYRMLSKNIAARYAENQKFLNLKYQIKNRKSGDTTVRIFKCPTCGQKVRVPKGKGKISIHCPKCNSNFIKRS